MKNNRCKKGFTLIELLVVVLIIGILAAIALPQYQKAVWKSRAAELISMARTLNTAQQAYLMANGSLAGNVDLLDISFDSLTRATSVAQSYGMNDGYVKNNEILLAIDDYGVTTIAAFATGPYAYAGFGIFGNAEAHTECCNTAGFRSDEIYCFEVEAYASGFCEKLQHGTYIKTRDGLKWYKMK